MSHSKNVFAYFTQHFKRFVREKTGQTAIKIKNDYGLIIFLLVTGPNKMMSLVKNWMYSHPRAQY
jgi:hypothetical protein